MIPAAVDHGGPDVPAGLSPGEMANAPPSVITRRQDRLFNRTWPFQSSTRAPAPERQQDAPLPPNDTRAWPIGKTYDHAWSHNWRFISLDIAAITSHWAPGFGVAKVPSALVVDMNVGRQNPIRERVNIKAPTSTAYGNFASVSPPDVYGDPRYLKLRP